MMRWGFLLVTLLTLCSCGPLVFPLNPLDSGMCAPACARMANLGCPEAEDLDEQTSCVEFCVQTQANGHALNPTCLAEINSCSEIESKCLKNRESL